MGAGSSVLPRNMGPHQEREQTRWVPFVGICTFSASRIPPDNIRHLFAPDETSSEPEDYDYDYDPGGAGHWDIDDGAVEHWLSNMDEHLA